MGAKQNFLIAIPIGRIQLSDALELMSPIVRDHIGALRTRSIQNLLDGTVEDSRIGEECTDMIPQFSSTQLVMLYPSDMTKGAVTVSHEEQYDMITLSLGEASPTVELLRRIWSAIGRHADAVLAGFELDAEGRDITSVLQAGEFHEQLELCEAGILRLPSDVCIAVQSSALENGGFLVIQ